MVVNYLSPQSDLSQLEMFLCTKSNEEIYYLCVSNSWIGIMFRTHQFRAFRANLNSKHLKFQPNVKVLTQSKLHHINPQ